MKENWEAIEKNRRCYRPHLKTLPGDHFGWFEFKTPNGSTLRCMVDDGMESGWEHVSVSVTDRGSDIPARVPSWSEMCHVKRQFWDDSETVVQFHPRLTEYVNHHELVLHLWKRRGEEYQLPPIICV